MHSLLLRQLKRFLGNENITQNANWQGFLNAIDEAYTAADQESAMVGRTLDLMSSELRERNQQLLVELKEKNKVEGVLLEKNDQLQAALTQLETAHMQLLQADKMASIGQLAAGVAHEINNPIAYVNSNLASLKTYVNDLFRLLSCYEDLQRQLPPAEVEAVQALQQEIDYAYLLTDIPLLLTQSHDGIERVRKIVKDLREFSHADSGEMALCDLNDGIRSTLNIVHNEFKDKAEIALNLADLPMVECNLGQLNQVFMNVIINACHAIKTHGHISISSGVEGPNVWVKITDDGEGIAPENLKRIFDAFFTTKPVGKGTGLGLSLSYSIIKNHHGNFDVSSVLGEGSTFLIHLPLRQP